jgi:hypothetical protein
MPNWLVKLEGEKFDLEDLPSLLRSPEHTVIEDNGSYYLKSSDFNSLSSADEVRECAIKIIEILNGAVKLHIHNFRSVSEDGVTLIEEDGSRHQYIYVRSAFTVRSKVRANPTVTTSNGTQQAAPLLTNVESWLSLAKGDKAVADALYFFRENTWGSLYKVYEIIVDDVGDQQTIIKNGWVTKHKLSQFTRIAQSRKALGDSARHAAKRYTPPPQPMTIQEAELLIRGVLLSWFRSKA